MNSVLRSLKRLVVTTRHPTNREPVVDRARVVAPILVGRERELELLASAVTSPPAVVTVEGEAGIGKTRLVAELADSPVLAGRRWLSGGCRRIREPFPLGPVLEALRGAADDLPGLRLSPVAGALRSLLPELSEALPAELAPLGDHAAERHRVFRALAELVSSLGPVVLVLEDMHWTDEQTVEFIAYLTADPPAGLALVLTFRPEEVESSVRAAVARLPRTVRRGELHLTPLDAAQTGVLGAAILGAARISDEFAGYLCARASGVPFAVEELLALLQARGSLVHAPAGWARRALNELDVPTAIRDSVLERVARLSDEARSVAEAAAVLEMPVPALRLGELCDGPADPRLRRAVDEAVTAGLLVERAQALVFRHVLAAQAVYEAIPSQRRAELHGRAAKMLEQQDPIPLGQLAHHLRSAGLVSDWVRAAEAAADAAIVLGHELEAVRLLEEPLQAAPLDDDHRWRLALKLGRAAAQSGQRRPDLVTLLERIPSQEIPPSARGELRFWLAMVMQFAGIDTQRQRELMIEAVEDLEDRPDLLAWAMVTLGIAIPHGVPVSEHTLWLERALDVVPSIGDAAHEVYLLGIIAMSLAYVGDLRWQRLAEDMVTRTGGTPRLRREADAYLRVAMAACHSGHYERASSLIAAVLREDCATWHPRTKQELASVVALRDFYRGDWDGLAERAQHLLEEHINAPLAFVDLEVIAACLALASGQVAAPGRGLLELAQGLEVTGDRSLDALVTAAICRQAARSAGVAEAVPCADRFVRALETKGLWAPLARALPAIVHLYWVAGQESRARRLVRRFTDEHAGLDAPLAPAALAHARGLLEAAEGHPRAAATHFLAAVAEYDRRACPYEAAQAREQAAAALFASDAAAAERELRAALAGYVALGASWDHAHCLRLGREHGLRFASTHRQGRKGYGDELSPREREVARLAAEGLTNKAIAAELYLSPNTVAKHVARAMGKLNVRSRAAIATRLAQRDDSGARSR